MRRIFIIALLSVFIGLAIGWFTFRPTGGGNRPTERKILFYRDPMNPQITSPTPKKSSDGMDFVPVYEEEGNASGERKIAYYKDPMHPWFTSDRPGKAPDCGMDMVPVYEDEEDSQGIKIDPVVVQNIGVKVESVKRRKLSKVIRTVGKIDYDETKVYSVNTKIMGWVEKLFVDYTGKSVRKGDPLMELYSPELVSTQEEYLQALRYQSQLEQSSIEEARRGAEQLVESARRRLLFWDIPDEEIRQLEKRGAPKKTLMFYSPVDGIVMEKMVFKGMNVMAGMDLYRIADLSTVWILADIYQFELPWVKVGDRAMIELSYLPGRSFTGVVTYIYPMLNMDTKTVKVRIEVKNTSTVELKPEMFAIVKIASPSSVEAVVVPDQAIIRSGERNIAVISLGGGYFEPRDVKLGMISEGLVQILDGIREGEKIVLSSQFLIDSESNLKAAISQMSGHEGMDMSKPMVEEESGEHKDHQQPKEDHQGHDTSTKSGMKKPESTRQAPKARDDRHDAHLRSDGDGKTQQTMSDTTSPINKAKEATKTVDEIDPVCGMEADPSGKYFFTYNGKTYYFCSEEDRETFAKAPQKYVPDIRAR